MVSSAVFWPRQSRPCGGGPGAGGGGRIACDRNEVEECASTCGHQPTTVRNGRQQGRDWLRRAEEPCTARDRRSRLMLLTYVHVVFLLKSDGFFHDAKRN